MEFFITADDFTILKMLLLGYVLGHVLRTNSSIRHTQIGVYLGLEGVLGHSCTHLKHQKSIGMEKNSQEQVNRIEIFVLK